MTSEPTTTSEPTSEATGEPRPVAAPPWLMQHRLGGSRGTTCVAPGPGVGGIANRQACVLEGGGATVPTTTNPDGLGLSDLDNKAEICPPGWIFTGSYLSHAYCSTP